MAIGAPKSKITLAEVAPPAVIGEADQNGPAVATGKEFAQDKAAPVGVRPPPALVPRQAGLDPFKHVTINQRFMAIRQDDPVVGVLVTAAAGLGPRLPPQT